MFVLKITTTVWLALIALGMASATLNEKATVSQRHLSMAVMFGQILAIGGIRLHTRKTKYYIILSGLRIYYD